MLFFPSFSPPVSFLCVFSVIVSHVDSSLSSSLVSLITLFAYLLFLFFSSFVLSVGMFSSLSLFLPPVSPRLSLLTVRVPERGT